MKPLVILVHGTRITKEEWAGYDELLPQAEVHAFDLPGHGDRQELRCTRTHILDAFDAALARRRPGQPVILVGHSLGGYFSMWYVARRRPDLAALVLVGATADPARPLAAVYRGFAKLLDWVGAERMTRFVNRVVRLVGVKEVQPGPELYEALGEAWQLVFDECGPERLHGVETPVWIINGQWDQMRLDARAYAEAAGGAQQMIVPGATHLLPLTHPEQLAERLRTICASVAGSSGVFAARETKSA
ncbi:alpha/beta fold hydrolase [Tessaracoccus sp. OH4464_COT-324]|uniref:alpha/beta fold hydrolase n=1 Tax=Tessaracoccus sp. OH4464_COT-324 TaxID=2491059 RepID=UPI000F642B8A|nr:alpha/beta hydrolase [Tessaracoccus sp. OH4464_COT-324]RRD46877.1 alpha/beta hydrolase [Tessaracoccus sp. OH4464_COT-324]